MLPLFKITDAKSISESRAGTTSFPYVSVDKKST